MFLYYLIASILSVISMSLFESLKAHCLLVNVYVLLKSRL